MLTDVHIIRVLLARLIAARCPLFVFLDGSDERFHSLLLDIDPTLDALIADELHPHRGHQRVRIGMPLRIASRLDGVELRFRSTVRALDTDCAVAAYLLDVPQEIDYREHRDLYRTRVSRTGDLVAHLHSGAHESVRGRVVDISISGVRLAVPAPHPLRPHEEWSCAVTLPNGAFDAPVSILHVRNAHARMGRAGPREDHVGARFRELSAHAARRLGHFMANAQRDLLRARRQPTLST